MTTSGAQNRARWAGAILLWAGVAASTLAIAQSKGAGERSPGWSEASARQKVGYAPDPPPMTSAVQWLLTFRYQQGKVELVSARQVKLAKPVTTPRRMGRYAVELLSGPTVVERLRFDFPLLGADELAGKRQPYHTPPRFENKATVVHRVMVPDTSRASRARLIDRATGTAFMIPWPPVSAAGTQVGAAPVRDAGAQDADAGRDAGRGDARGDAPADAPLDGGLPDAQRPDAPPAPIPMDGGRRP